MASWFSLPSASELIVAAPPAVAQAGSAVVKIASHLQRLRLAQPAPGQDPFAAVAIAPPRKTTVTELVRRDLTPEEMAAAEARYAADLEAWEATVAAMDVEIVDLGNACWTHKHFSDDIQTRQYRAPEVIITAPYDTAADIWSLGCMVFELLTGDLLFDPAAGDGYERDEDHLAQMQELLGPIPPDFAVSGSRSAEFFGRDGLLRHIKDLRFWGPGAVLADKYSFDPIDAAFIDAFVRPMLEFLPELRVTAETAIEHPWLALQGNSESEGFIEWSKHVELALEVLQELQPLPLPTPSANLFPPPGDDEERLDDELSPGLTSPATSGGGIRSPGQRNGRAQSAGAAHAARRARSLDELLDNRRAGAHRHRAASDGDEEEGDEEDDDEEADFDDRDGEYDDAEEDDVDEEGDGEGFAGSGRRLLEQVYARSAEPSGSLPGFMSALQALARSSGAGAAVPAAEAGVGDECSEGEAEGDASVSDGEVDPAQSPHTSAEV